MDPNYYVIFVIIGLVFLIRWRMMVAQKKIEGIPAPESETPYHPEGMLLYFYSPNCGPCRQMKYAIEDLSEKYPDRIKQINVAEDRDTALKLGIRGTPTTLLIKDNKVEKAIIGAKSFKALDNLLSPEKTLNS